MRSLSLLQMRSREGSSSTRRMVSGAGARSLRCPCPSHSVNLQRLSQSSDVCTARGEGLVREDEDGKGVRSAISGVTLGLRGDVSAGVVDGDGDGTVTTTSGVSLGLRGDVSAGDVDGDGEGAGTRSSVVSLGLRVDDSAGDVEGDGEGTVTETSGVSLGLGSDVSAGEVDGDGRDRGPLGVNAVEEAGGGRACAYSSKRKARQTRGARMKIGDRGMTAVKVLGLGKKTVAEAWR